MTRILVALVTSLATAGLARPAAQESQPSFEVASVRRNTSGTGLMTVGMAPGGRLNMTNLPVRNLIVRAYGVQPYQIVGGPDWIGADRFDVVAKAASADATPEQINAMMRSLLADRFKLVARRETRELPVYYLVKAREDGRLGPELKPAEVDCGAAGRGRGGPQPGPGAPVPGPRAGGFAPGPGAGGCGLMIAPGRLQMGGQPIAAAASTLANQVGRPIVDKTGLEGNYDLTLSWMPEAGRGAPAGPLPPGAPDLPPIDPDAPSLFTAVQEQLGLKLESARGPVEVIVIESIQPPLED
jgi:uncharacterized protein (TIGR03435 family)